jgi:hypothetical protein
MLAKEDNLLSQVQQFGDQVEAEQVKDNLLAELQVKVGADQVLNQDKQIQVVALEVVITEVLLQQEVQELLF